MLLILTTLALSLAIEPDVDSTFYQLDDEPARVGYPSAENPVWDCGNAGGQIAINRCYHDRSQAAEVQMEAAHDAFLGHFIPEGEEVEPPIVEDQQEAQAAFLTYREIHCTTLSYSQGGGSATDMVLYKCMSELTEMRARHLINLVELF